MIPSKSCRDAREPIFGVKVDYQLALDLYDTGNSDAMYLAGLIADDAKMSKKDLQRWVDQAYWYMLSEYTVSWVATGSAHGRDLALKWIEAKKEAAAVGSAVVSLAHRALYVGDKIGKKRKTMKCRAW